MSASDRMPQRKPEEPRYRHVSYAGSFDDWADAEDARLFEQATRRSREQSALDAYLDGE